MYSRKGFRPSRKALTTGGFNDALSVYFVSWLMCVPGCSENKAIAIAKHYKTFGEMMEQMTDPMKSEKDRKQLLTDVPVPSVHLGGKPTKVGKTVAERLFFYYMSYDPKL